MILMLMSKIFQQVGKIKTYLMIKYYQRIYSPIIAARFKKMEGIIINPSEIKGECYISIGKNTSIGHGCRLTAWDKYETMKFNPIINIGNNTIINEFVHITACNKIHIGNNVLTGRYVYISDNSHGYLSSEEIRLHPVKRPLYSKGPVIIEDNVWIGEHVCILAGVTIGYGSVIAANAVVTHDIPAGVIAGGVPAKIIKRIS